MAILVGVQAPMCWRRGGNVPAAGGEAGSPKKKKKNLWGDYARPGVSATGYARCQLWGRLVVQDLVDGRDDDLG